MTQAHGTTGRPLQEPPGEALKDIQAFTFRDLAGRKWGERRHVIAPWLEAGESAMLWAGPGVGKTMLALTLALVAAGGGEVAGWRSPRPHKVLLVDGEMRGRDLAERLQTLCGAVQGIDREAALDNIEVRARQLQRPDAPFYDIARPETQRAIIRDVEAKEIDLLILDNVTTLADSLGDENDVAALRPVLAFLMDLKKTGAAVLLVHHANKGGQTYRGSTALPTTFEVIIGLTKPEGEPVGSASFKLHFTKYRGKADGSTEPRTFALGDFGWTVGEDEEDDTARLLRAVRSCEHGTQEAAGRAAGIGDKTKVSKLLTKAKANGKITRHGIKRCLEAAGEIARGDPGDCFDDTM